jgi:hypothetical protein
LVKKLKNKDSSENLTKKHTPWIRDPEKIPPESGSLIKGVKKYRIPDLVSRSATLAWSQLHASVAECGVGKKNFDLNFTLGGIAQSRR